ncbi:MAG: CPBP family intramembrane metalloprotease [Gemmatimonadetes bacterium]|nr:CPBP family intramembrane metalloprotease [Gemmatimonadota bacterium]
MPRSSSFYGWLPIDFGLLRGLRLPVGATASLDAARLFAMDVGLVLFVVAAPVRDLGFTFGLRLRDLGYAAAALAACALVLVPLGLAIGFLRYGWPPLDPGDWWLNALNIYFLVAVPEEFLFRGLLQNSLEKRWRGPQAAAAAWLAVSVVFGAAHLNNPPAPNFRYAALATLAGMAYGWVWWRTRKVTASALTHGAVDWIWLVALRG